MPYENVILWWTNTLLSTTFRSSITQKKLVTGTIHTMVLSPLQRLGHYTSYVQSNVCNINTTFFDSLLPLKYLHIRILLCSVSSEFKIFFAACIHLIFTGEEAVEILSTDSWQISNLNVPSLGPPIFQMKGTFLMWNLWWSLLEKNDTLWRYQTQSKIITAPPEDSPFILGLLVGSVNQKCTIIYSSPPQHLKYI